jgi:hypothetical protein
MLILQKPALRAVRLAKDNMTYRLKTCAAPRFEECIDLRPPLEHDSDAVLLQ